MDSYSRPDVPPVAVLRDDTGQSWSLELEKADISKLLAAGWKPPMPITVKARDGQTDLYGLMFQPDEPRSGRRSTRSSTTSIPVRRPAASEAAVSPPRAAMRRPWPSWASSWSRWTAWALRWRSKKFHEAYYGNMGDNTLPDQVAGDEAAGAARYPWIDIDRAGIYGHSGGGYATADAMFRYPDFFKVGISEAGNHDNREYEDDWGEKWQGLLKRNPDGTTNYDNQANQNVCQEPEGPPAAGARNYGQQRPALQHAAGGERADQGEQGFRPACCCRTGATGSGTSPT